MSNTNDFVIKNGVLKMYEGKGGDVIIPDGVKSIGNLAFYGWTSLTSITIPDSLKSIGYKAFSGCKSLTSITIPDSVTSIGESAFSHCTSLTGITIPDSVTNIGSFAFSGCTSMKSITIPDSVKKIGDWAFRGCTSLTNVTIGNSVTSIGESAFDGCTSLTSVTIPDRVTSIGDSAFRGCKGLGDKDGFVVVQGVLYDYLGSGGNIVIPDSVTSIGYEAFHHCKSLTSITIPDSVTSIGYRAFHGCTSLISITIPGSVKSIGVCAFGGCESLTSVTIGNGVKSIGNAAFSRCKGLTSITIPVSVKKIGENVFYGCSKLEWIKSPIFPCSSNAPGIGFALLLTGKKSRYFAYASKTDNDNISNFAKSGHWSEYDKELINNGPVYKYKVTTRIIGALGRLLNPVELSEDNRALIAELLSKNAKKLVPIAEQSGDINIIEGLISLNILDDKTVKAVKKLLAASALPDLAALANKETMITVKPAASKKSAKSKQESEQTEQSPLQKEFAAKFKAIKGDAVIKKMKLIGTAMPKVKLTDGTYAPDELFRFLLVSYGSQMGKDYYFDSEADAAAKLLSYDSLCDAMDSVSGHLDGPNYPAVLPLLCRCGNAQQIKALTDAWKQWGEWNLYGRKGRTAQEVLSAALVLSDTRQAVVWLEKNASLKRYAEIRNVAVDDVYDRFLFDFGFDESGKRIFDLGVTTIEVTLTPSLTLALYNTEKKKAARAIPKKGVDPVVQKKASDELADMRQNLKKAAKIKSDHLFAAYLDATVFSAENWKKSYLSNPFSRQSARLLVWEQAGRFFTLIGDHPVDSEKQPFTLGEEPIRVAHPMEMKQEEIEAWQLYFSSNDLKQLFLQVWEPAYQEADFREDRYKGCHINPLYLKSKQRLGIKCEWYESEYYEYHDLEIEGFDVTTDSDYLEITSLRPKVWNRRTSSVIAYLDRITVYDRIKKDDVSVMNQMERFTLAQITEFITAAQEANAVNVLAALMEYKNANFADLDPMDEFVLEW